MSTTPISNAGDVYQFIDDIKIRAAQQGMPELAVQLENSLRLGSSALEILGAARKVIIDNKQAIRQLSGPDGEERVKQVIAFVDRSYGR